MNRQAAVAAITIAGLLAASGASARANSSNVAHELRPTSVSAYGGVVAWSHFDPASKRYLLVAQRNGMTETLPVQGRRVPFDVDLGPDARGRTTAVYSRCRTEPELEDHRTHLPAYWHARGCRLYAYRLGSAGEHALRKVGSHGYSAFLPAIWKGEVAYAIRRDTREAEVLLRRSSIASGRTWSLPGGPRAARPGGVDPGDVDLGPTAVDLRGRSTIVTWASMPSACPQSATDGDRADPTRTDLVLINGRRRSLLRIACNYDDRPSLIGAGFLGAAEWTTYSQLAGAATYSASMLTLSGVSLERATPVTTNVVSAARVDDATAIVVRQPELAGPVDIVQLPA